MDAKTVANTITITNATPANPTANKNRGVDGGANEGSRRDEDNI